MGEFFSSQIDGKRFRFFCIQIKLKGLNSSKLMFVDLKAILKKKKYLLFATYIKAKYLRKKTTNVNIN
jgi:hypothetical protein